MEKPYFEELNKECFSFIRSDVEGLVLKKREEKHMGRSEEKLSAACVFF